MNYEFVTYKSTFYKQAVAIRIAQFFEGMDHANELIMDRFEENSSHLICRDDHQVVGTGRLHFIGKEGVISQMAIARDFQDKGIGKEIVICLMEDCKNKKMEKIVLSARETAIDFYKKFGFRIKGEKYPSQKTGVIHQQMEHII